MEEARHLGGQMSGWCLELQEELQVGAQVVDQADLVEGEYLLVLHMVAAWVQGDHAQGVLEVHALVGHVPVVHVPVVHAQVVHAPVAHDPVAHDPVAHDPGVHAVVHPYQVEGLVVVAAWALVAWVACGRLVVGEVVLPLVEVWVAYHQVEADSACGVALLEVVQFVTWVVLAQGLGDHAADHHSCLLLEVHRILGVGVKEAHSQF